VERRRLLEGLLNMGIILAVTGWAAALVLAEVTVSCAWRNASARFRFLPRWSPRVPDAGWLLPELAGSACAAVLALLGAAPALPGAIAAAVLFLAAGLPLARVMWQAARQGKAGYAGRRIASMLALLAWTARAFLMEDLRALARRGEADGAPPPPPGGPATVRAAPGVPPWRRTVPGVPSILADPALGDVPAPSEVSAALAASGVTVPPAWAAVAAEAADFEPESDEELCEHMDGEVAGVLTWAEAVMARAKTLGDVAGLDPAYVAAQYELADDVAELAAHGAQVMRRYHDIYDDLREAADGRPLPANRYWFGDGGGAPQGGRAA
jgi:hypothetical protein